MPVVIETKTHTPADPGKCKLSKARTYARASTHMHARTYTPAGTHVRAQVYACACACVHASACLHAALACMRVRARMYTHARTRAQASHGQMINANKKTNTLGRICTHANAQPIVKLSHDMFQTAHTARSYWYSDEARSNNAC